MGANIEEVDYDGIIRKAKQIAAHCDNIQRDIQQAFEVITSMREHWYGNSYDIFANSVNLTVDGLNDVFMNMVVTYPLEISAKAKSYARGNQSDTTESYPDNTAIRLTEISLTNKGTKLRFQEDNVKADQEKIKGKFEDAVKEIEEAKQVTTSLKEVWSSISGDTNIAELEKAFKRVNTIMTRISTNLEKQITTQAFSINALEGAAGAVEAANNLQDSFVDSAEEAIKNAVNNIQQSASDIWRSLTGRD